MVGTVTGVTARTVAGIAPASAVITVAVATGVVASVAVVVVVAVLIATTVAHAGAAEPDCMETEGDMAAKVGTVCTDAVATAVAATPPGMESMVAVQLMTKLMMTVRQNMRADMNLSR